ncbi:major capsid protein [Hoyosella altamirensis]|uniref:Major capsid protein n=1 Tax=Hoyosella altamirensis TaxID=616997 RepID=A0A839RVS9_9ACTN|nr:major capsid protein [Hoyosella altamirensis]MBB3040124.1 hypothetical protein [Hoyosella altamirensis]
MAEFELPAELPSDLDGLDGLRAEANTAFDDINTEVGSGVPSQEQLDKLSALADAIHKIDDAKTALAEAENQRAEKARELIESVKARNATEDSDGTEEEPPSDAAEVVAEAEQATQEAAEEVDAPEPVAAAATPKPVKRSFAGATKKADIDVPKPKIGWSLSAGAPGWQHQGGNSGLSFRDFAKRLDDNLVAGGRLKLNRPQNPVLGGPTVSLATLQRDGKVIEDAHALVAAINEVSDERNLPGGSLTAACGWCGPGETVYNFCDVPNATNLLTLPEFIINRGGLRFPADPDYSELFADIPAIFTEEDLCAEPAPEKPCLDIPCLDEWIEIEPEALWRCVRAGFLEQRGWPERIEHFLRSLTQWHLRRVSALSVAKIIAGSDAITIPADSQIAASSAVLNSLALVATNLRIQHGLGDMATIQGFAPTWVKEVIRADLANQAGVSEKNISDAQITGWLTARNIFLQFISDWQTNEPGLPGSDDTTEWPGAVEIVLFPAGTWVRHLRNVIELSNVYDHASLTVNQFTRLAVEDEFQVWKRCYGSKLVTIPICPSGAIGPRQAIACATPTP